MNLNKKSIEDIDLAGKRVFIRVRTWYLSPSRHSLFDGIEVGVLHSVTVYFGSPSSVPNYLPSSCAPNSRRM